MKLRDFLICLGGLLLMLVFMIFEVFEGDEFSSKPRFWWIRRRAYRKWKEEREKYRQELLLEIEKEKKERQKAIDANEIIEMSLGPGVPATAFEIHNL